MIYPIRQTLVLAIAAALTGCSASSRKSPFDDWVQNDPRTWQLADHATVHTAATLQSTSSSLSNTAIPQDAGPVDYVHMALRRNPGIKAAQLKVQRLHQRIVQAKSLDDPQFTVAGIGEMAETAARQVGLMTGLSQKLPTPGKLDLRGRIAQQDVTMATADLAEVRLGVIADTRRAFWSYYFTTRGIEVIEQDRKLLSQFKQIASSKYRAGTATRQDVLRASVELSNLDNQLITLHQQQRTAMTMLNSLLDRPINAELPQPKVVELKEISLQLGPLLAQASQTNPKLQRIHERIEAFRQRLKLAKLNRWPDLTASIRYNTVDSGGLSPSANGKDQWWIGVGVSLPIWWEKLDAGEREARRGIFEGVADLTNQRNRVAFAVQDALIKVQTQQRLVLLMRDVIVPQARQTVEVSESGYRSGKLNFLTIVDNWRKLLDFELMYHQSLSQLEQNFAQLQQVVGRDLPRKFP